MAKPYPLYDKLRERVNLREEKSIDIKRLGITINLFSQKLSQEEYSEHYKEIAGLILHHEILNNGFLTPFPFGCKVMSGGKGLLYNIKNLPPILQQILAEYLEEYTY
jgi:hypothetical protein